MNMKLNVEELRREILEGARAVPLAQGRGVKEVGERSEKGCYAERGCEVEEEDGGEETSVLHSVEVELREVGLEEGMLGWF